jgi:uncharacterized protein YrzB (UPF0473 family)
MTFLNPEHVHNGYDTLTAIVMIKENLDEPSCLRIFDVEGNNWDASFHFTVPANEFELEKAQSRWYLPHRIRNF